MKKSLKDALWKNFGASIDMLENAIIMCPERLWDTETRFWLIAYHSLFFLDYYLTLKPETFSPPPPFSSSLEDPFDNPDRVYTKDELLSWLKACRHKCRKLIAALTDEMADQRWVISDRNYPLYELLLKNMRHVQHHTAQLNILLRQNINDAPPWISATKTEL